MRRLIAVLGALAAGCALFAGIVAMASFSLVEERPYVAYPNIEEVRSFDFMAASYQQRVAQGDNPVLVFGTSELDPAAMGDSYFTRMFSGGQFDMDIMVGGRTFCEDIWQAIEIGALEPQLVDKRVVVFPSMQWFMQYRTPQRELQAAYSQSAYQAFLANDKISDETKAAVTQRMKDYGVNRTPAQLPWGAWSDGLDGAVQTAMTNVALAYRLPAFAEKSVNAAGSLQPLPPRNAEIPVDDQGNPDWETLKAEGLAAAMEHVTNNDLGFYDKEYTSWRNDESYRATWRYFDDGSHFSTQEFEDFNLMLDVCNQVGVEPLIIIQPAKGVAYDGSVYNQEVRQEYYAMIHAACDAHGVACVDLTCYEYDTYFMRDQAHPSPYGSVFYAEAIYNFFNEDALCQ